MTTTATVLGLTPSFGFGDRLGVATPGHVAALRESGGGIAPIFAQQSIREMTRTGRSADQVVGDAFAGAAAAGYTGPQGADADHLKTTADIDRTAAAGFCFFTLDPSEQVDPNADAYSPNDVVDRFHPLADEAKWPLDFLNNATELPTGTKIKFDQQTIMRAAIKYGQAMVRALELAGHVQKSMWKLGRPYEIELSVDETPQPTTVAEHFMIAGFWRKRNTRLVSLAPRFVGDFEKGVDFKGDLASFERSLADHAAIADLIGPYKLSLHSGSDKLSIYPMLARHTKGRFHVKTAGTSYLEALRAVLRHDVELFRQIVEFARQRYDMDRATYHVSATLDTTPPPTELNDVELEQIYLERWQDVPGDRGFIEPGRQILHTTFGSVLTHPKFGPAIMQILREHRSTYDEILREHFGRHLLALRRGM